MDIFRAVMEGDEVKVKRRLDADPTLIEAADDGGMRLLAVAAYHNQLPMVRLLVQRGADTNATGVLGLIALHYAAHRGNEEVAAFFLSKDVQANSKNGEGRTPIMEACNMGHLGVVRLLAEHLDAQGLDEKDKEGWTALHYAAHRGDAEVVACLLEEGAQANSRDNEGRTPLILAYMRGHLGVVRVLAQRIGAQGLDESDNEGKNALHYAAHRGDAEVMAYLLEEGAQANSRDNEGRTPLILACMRGYLGVVRVLAQRIGAQGLDESDNEGKTALHYAAHRGDAEVMAYLLEEGAQANSRDNEGRTPLILACMRGYLGVVRVLAQRIGAQGLDESDNEGKTALHYAARQGGEAVMSYLLGEGAQANSRDDYGATPLMRACGMGDLGVVQVLLPHLGPQGLEARDDDGWTALHWAVYEGHSEIVTFLLSKGAQATSRDNHGGTPFLRTCSMGRLGIVRLFLQRFGPQVLQERDNDGETALHWAAAEGQEEVVRCLLLAGADPTSTSLQGKTSRTFAEEENEEEDGKKKEGKAKCVALFEWWNGELERRAILARATCLHRADTMRRDMPTSQVPSYLEARVAAGHAVPRVEVVSSQSEETQEGKQTGARGKRKAAGEGDGAQGAEEGVEEEMNAMLKYVVTALNEELAIELLEGFHREK